MSARRSGSKRSKYSSGKRASRGTVRNVRARLQGLGTGAVGGHRRQNVRTAGFLGIEHKFYDTFLISSVINVSGTAANGMKDPSSTIMISAPAQGDTASSRDGKKILIESVLIEGFIFIPNRIAQVNLDEGQQFYVALIQDHQTNASQMVSEDAFVNPSGNSKTGCQPLKNLLASTRFTTHKVWRLNPPLLPCTDDASGANAFSIAGARVDFSCYKKLNMEVNFNGGTTASIANVVDNSLHLVAWTNEGNGAEINYNARIRFVG